MPETAADRQLLARLEARVDQGLSGTADALEALLEIQRRRLYAGDWWEYVRRRWPRHERTVYRLLARAEVAANVTAPPAPDSGPEPSATDPMGQKSTDDVPRPNERQARELNRLRSPEAQREVWQAVCRQAGAAGGRVTAEKVKDAVDRYLAAERGAPPTAEEARRASADIAGRAARDALARAVATVKSLAGKIELAAGKFDAGPQEKIERGLALIREAVDEQGA